MADRANRDHEKRYHLKPWKIVLLLFAGLLVAAGVILTVTADEPERTTPDRTETSRPGDLSPARGLFPGSDPRTTDGEPREAGRETDASEAETEPWSPVLLRGGLSFFVGFALAFALRMFMKIALFFVGVFVASLFLLENVGFLTMHWDLADAWFNDFSGHLGAQFESMKAFVTGSLPSAGMAGLGLLAGFRRK